MTSFLHWETDPLLFDEKSTLQNQWTTANSLIEINQSERIFLPDKSTINLYPILVR